MIRFCICSKNWVFLTPVRLRTSICFSIASCCSCMFFRISSFHEAKHEEMKSEDSLERGCPCSLVGLPQCLIIPDMLMQGLMGCSCSFVKIASLTKNMLNITKRKTIPGFRLPNKRQSALESCLEDPCEGSRIIASNRRKLRSTL